jgi:hypothetical protein
MANNVTIYYQNCRGLRTKLHTLFMSILTNSYDIIILTETWLNADIFDTEFIDNRYIVYRADRDRVASGRRDGGGVLIAVKRTLCAAGCAPAAAATPTPLPSVVDQILIEFKFAKRLFCIGAVYIPPKQTHDIYFNYLKMLQSWLLYRNSDVTDFFIAGDFNLPELLWINKEPYKQYPSMVDFNLSHLHISNFMAEQNCFQLNIFRNYNNRILDLFFTNKRDCQLFATSDILLPIDPHHPPFCVSFVYTTRQTYIQPKPFLRYCYKNADFDKIINELANTNWDELFLYKEASAMVSIFYKKIYDIIDCYVPKHKSNHKAASYPAWFSMKLINIYNKKNQAWINMKKYSSQSNYSIYSIYRKKFKILSEKCYKAYMAKVENGVNDNVKYFWKYVSRRRILSDIPSSVRYESDVSSSPDECCELFSRFFQSVFQPSSVTNDLSIDDLSITPDNVTDVYLQNITVSRAQVRKVLRNLDISKGAGTDNLPGVFFKKTSSVIDLPLTSIYNKCLSDGIFPNIWKSARIVPVHKDGSKADVTNYRPISILPILSKVFERLVHDAIYPHLHNIILQEQHGFVKRRSTITNLLLYTSDLFLSLEANIQTDSIYTDFRKAFDTVDHKILLQKIAFNGIRGNLWRWFKSYISNRTQKVVIKGSESEVAKVTSGVPQGSILGPLLFVIFINDVKKCFKHSRVLLYADDLKIYRKINNVDDQSLLQEDLNRFDHYCSQNHLQLSLNKCKLITFTKKIKINEFNYSLGGKSLTRVSNIKDLGITLDSKLHFDIHIQNIIRKAFKMYGFVMRSSCEFKNPDTLKYLFKSLIRPQLEYGVSIWNPFYEKYNYSIEMVQKKFLRRIGHKFYRKRLSYIILLKKCNLLDLKSRRLLLDARLLYDLCNNKYDCINLANRISYLVPTRAHRRSSRTNSLFAVTRSRTNAGIRSPLNRMLDTYNKKFSSVDIFSSGSMSYSRQVTELLTNQ